MSVEKGVYKNTFKYLNCGDVRYYWHHNGKRLENLPKLRRAKICQN